MTAPDLLGKPVVARFVDGTEYARGVAFGHSDQPTYDIERPDGTRFAWREDMCVLDERGEWFPPTGQTDAKKLAAIDTFALVAELVRRGFLKAELDLSQAIR